MAIINASQLNSGVIMGNVTNVLKQLREAFNSIEDMHGWTSELTAADLETVGFSSTDANALLAAMNDAHAEHQFRIGSPMTGYAPNYPYAQTQEAFIGPN
jgi:hypothetical protein